MSKNPAMSEKIFSLSDRDGSFYQSGDTYCVRFERILDQPIGCVWAALTEPDQVSAWLAPTTIKGRAGGSISVKTVGGIMGGKILQWKDNELLEYKWYQDSIVRWELLPDGEPSCRLTFTFRLAPKSQLKDAATGWHYHLDALAVIAAGEKMPAIRIGDWEKISGKAAVRYEALLQQLGHEDPAEKAPFVIERTFNSPVSRVWKALTDKDEIRQWSFTIAEFEPRVGFDFTFYGEHETTRFVHFCRITEIIPERKMTYSWRYEGVIGISFVSFELFPEGDKTRLRLTHTGLENFAHAGPHYVRTNFMTGWTSIFDQGLAPLLGV
jgi:uncharacterized protein YndB with AHSA1/START domain